MSIDYTWAIHMKRIVPFDNEMGYSIYAQWVKIGSDLDGRIGYYTDEFTTECRPGDEDYIEKPLMNDLAILLLITKSLSEEQSAKIDEAILNQIESQTGSAPDVDMNTHVLT